MKIYKVRDKVTGKYVSKINLPTNWSKPEFNNYGKVWNRLVDVQNAVNRLFAMSIRYKQFSTESYEIVAFELKEVER